MKTITIDFDTYQAELAIAEEVKEDMYDQGSAACEERYRPLLEYLQDCLKNDYDIMNVRIINILKDII